MYFFFFYVNTQYLTKIYILRALPGLQSSSATENDKLSRSKIFSNIFPKKQKAE